MKYLIYIPNGYTKDKKWPLVIWLHGPDYGRYLMDTTKKTSGLGGIIQGGRDYDALVLIPQEVWTRDKIHLRFVKEEMIPKIVEEYNIDTNKISLSGHSLAAGHALNMAEMYPGFFSAITPLSLCKTVDPKPLLPSKIWIYHGNADTVCNQKPGNKMVKDITAAGGFCKFTVIRAEHSNTDDKAIYNYNTIEWMIKQTLGQPVVE
ncbi:hypothetical protein SDC9_179539 [bioreactor metagenome]|uniref:Phospholipase/carboxylesterase/thioesterase domain-containing protein n=1 Tax=bioreactor metagenome TaxID=1076179 RepID=A0A645H8F5_9ZZZZ